MSNVKKYGNAVAFHPGYYISEIINDMGITVDEFAAKIGTTPKTMEKLINGECDLSDDLIQKFSSAFGMNTGFWFNLQSKYKEKK